MGLTVCLFIGRDSPPLKQSQSNRRERVGLRAASGKILVLCEPVVGRRAAERDPVALIVGVHTGECAAPGDSPLEAVDVRRFLVRLRGLVAVAILVQPRDWERVRAAVGRRYASGFRAGRRA